MKQNYVVQNLADEFGVVLDARLIGSKKLKIETGTVTLAADATSVSIPSPANAHVVAFLPDDATAAVIRQRTSGCIPAMLFTDLIAVSGISQTPGLIVKQIRAANGSVGSGTIASTNLKSPPLTASASSSMPIPAGTYQWTAFCWD